MVVATRLLVEGGGSRTRMSLVGGDGLATVVDAGSINPRSVGRNAATHRLQSLIAKGITTSGMQLSVDTISGWSLAWASTVAELAGLAEAITRALPTQPGFMVICNDVLPLMFLPRRRENVVSVVAGTGTSFLARSGKRWARASGHEYLLSDEGGGFDIGLQGLRAVVRASDGRGDRTLLTQYAATWCSSDPAELLAHIHRNGQHKPRVAGFAREVLQAAADGDAVASKIIDGATNELMIGLRSVLRRTNMLRPNTVVLGGTLLTSRDSELRARFRDRIRSVFDGAELLTAPSDPLGPLTATVDYLARHPAATDGAASAVPVVIYTRRAVT